MSEGALVVPRGAPAPTALRGLKAASALPQLPPISPQLLRRAAPLAAVAALLALAVLGWSWLSPAPRAPLFPGLSDADKAEVSQTLQAAGFDVELDGATGAVTVPRTDLQRARIALAAQGLPKAVPGGYDLLGELPLGASRSIERARLKQAQEGELARAVEGMAGVASARVLLGLPDQTPFLRDAAGPSASVFVTLQPGRALGDGQVRAIQHLVASSVPGLAAEHVSVVDGAGQLLSGDGDGGPLGESARELAHRQRLERLYRERVISLLTPVVGQGNFSTQVNLDLDFTRAEATSERYSPGALRSEATTSRQDGTPAPRGIPGALSNLAPPPPTTSATPPASLQSGAALPPAQQGPTNSETSATRNFELGRDVSVRREPVGGVRKLAVAVVIRADAAKSADPAMLRDLVSASLGADQRRGDVVTVVRAPFSPPAAEAEVPLWRQLVDAHAGKAVALIAVLGAAAILRPKLRRRQTQPAAAAPDELPAPADSTGGDQAETAAAQLPGSEATALLTSANSYDAKIEAIRRFASDDPARATAVLKQLLTEGVPA